jgi:hypothetical protein
MNKRALALMMTGVMVMSMSTGVFAAKDKGGKPDTTKPPATQIESNLVTSPGGIIVTTPDQSTDISDYKALQNQLDALNKQLNGANDRLKKATGKDKKSLENSTAAYQKQIDQIKAKIAAILKAQGKTDDKVTDKQAAYIKGIEANLKKNNPTIVMVQSDKIVTDNLAIKADLPLAVKDGVVYMAQSTLEKSFGITIKYENTQNKFISKIEGSLVEMFLKSNLMEIDGVPKKVESKPIAIEKDNYFPINTIDKLLKIEVKWDKELKVISIDDLDIVNPVPVQ